MKTDKILLLSAAVLSGSAVAIGAFAAHGLKPILSAQALQWMQTGVQYQLHHSIAILVLAFALKLWPAWSLLAKAAYSFIMGSLLFSGSLYFMALTGSKALVLLTPLGGLSFIIGWGLLALAVWQREQNIGSKK